MKETKKPKPRYFFLSLALHAALIGLLAQRKLSTTIEAPNEPVSIEVVTLSPAEVAKIKNIIVETAKQKKADVAAPKSFLSEQTQVVDRQTRAKTSDHYLDGAAAAGNNGKSSADKLKSTKFSDLGVKMNMKPMGHMGPPGTVATTNDSLKDIGEGAQTLLNTKEFIFFSYYQRIRRQLEQFYGPSVNKAFTKMFRQGRFLAAEKEHTTKLVILLDKEGVIKQIVIEDTSGIRDIDQAAIDAFNKAGPFPNPPVGMIDGQGIVRIDWNLVFQT